MVIIAVDPIRIIEETRDARNRSEMNQLKIALQLFFNDQNSYPASGLPALTAALEPNYTRVLPSVTNEASFVYASTATSYEGGIVLDHPTGDDASSVTACLTDPPAVDGNFKICPD